MSDHIPIIAEIEITGPEDRQGTRIGQKTIPTIRSGDAGAKKRLEKMMKKELTGDLGDWTLEEIVGWTANASKEIALSRNRKDNPNGWSPLIRLMRLKVKALGAILKRLEMKKTSWSASAFTKKSNMT